MSQDSVESPLQWTFRAVDNTWKAVKSVYWANSPSWRFLKSGALVFLGFFLWMAANVLLSFQSSWQWLHYPMAYGFVLVVYGPFHHAVVIPLAVRLRKGGRPRLSKRLPNASLGVFFAIVLVLGAFPPGVMAFDFTSAIEDSTGTDIDPDLLCTKSTHDGTTHVHCHLTESRGIDNVRVESGGEVVTTDEAPPFEFTVSEDDLSTVTGQKQFQVVLRDGDGNGIRRYTRTLTMIEESG